MQQTNGINKRRKGCAIKYTHLTKTKHDMYSRNILRVREGKHVPNYFDL